MLAASEQIQIGYRVDQISFYDFQIRFLSKFVAAKMILIGEHKGRHVTFLFSDFCEAISIVAHTRQTVMTVFRSPDVNADMVRCAQQSALGFYLVADLIKGKIVTDETDVRPLVFLVQPVAVNDRLLVLRDELDNFSQRLRRVGNEKWFLEGRYRPERAQCRVHSAQAWKVFV